ncbi:Wzz/FepE/Etk N-terminal domain-containing protein [Vibrio furnissii]|uniref:Wzz/FepE/Etk N-terminal domain-containing protein n=1 Tax=Vibrio furnissii TaxID=29494 RepID=UPI003AA8DFA8
MQQNPIQYQSYPSSSTANNEIDLREFFTALWKGKWVIISITVIFAIGSVIYAVKQPNIYKADALLASAETSSNGGLSNMAGQLGGLAALAGVNIGAAEFSQADLAVQVMQSRQFIESFIKKHDLLVPLMAAKGWDISNNKLLISNEIYDEKTQHWKREPKGMRGAQPSAQEAYDVFLKSILSVAQDEDSGLYTISVMHYSPYIAQTWVSWLVQDINTVMRERAISETTQNLAYLSAQLQKTAVADMRSTFYTLIEEQTKSLMLAEVQEEFVFKIIDPAVVPEVKYKPKRALICIGGTFLGGMLGIAIVLVGFAFRKEAHEVHTN